MAAVRVNWTRLVLSTLRSRDEPAHAHVLERVASRDVLAKAGRVAWIPLSVHVEVCEALRTELGDPGFREHFCHATLASGNGPLFRPLVRGFLTLFGRTPASTVRAAPQAWSFIFRDLGTLAVGPATGTRVPATIEALHPSLRDRDTFITGVLGAFDATLGFIDFDGSVLMDASKLDKGRVDYEVSWTGPRS